MHRDLNWLVAVSIVVVLCLVLPWHAVFMTNHGNGSGDTTKSPHYVWGVGESSATSADSWYNDYWRGHNATADVRIGFPLFVIGSAGAITALAFSFAPPLRPLRSLIGFSSAALIAVGAGVLMRGMSNMEAAWRTSLSSAVGIEYDSGFEPAVALPILLVAMVAYWSWMVKPTTESEPEPDS